MIYSCAKCGKLHEDRSDEARSLCLECWRDGWRFDGVFNLVQLGATHKQFRWYEIEASKR